MFRGHVRFSLPLVSTVTKFHRAATAGSYNNAWAINHVYYYPYYDARWGKVAAEDGLRCATGNTGFQWPTPWFLSRKKPPLPTATWHKKILHFCAGCLAVGQRNKQNFNKELTLRGVVLLPVVRVLIKFPETKKKIKRERKNYQVGSFGKFWRQFYWS